MATLKSLLRRSTGRMKESHTSGDEGKSSYVRKATDALGGGQTSIEHEVHASNKHSASRAAVKPGKKGSGDRWMHY